MPVETQSIQQHLERVAALRSERLANGSLAQRVAAIKRHQHLRFGRDYAGLIGSPRYGAAAGFFLSDLYGPEDFADRDAQFGRVASAMARALPSEVMHTVAHLVELHALSEELDQRMARALLTDQVDDRSYRGAWLTVDRREQRERQLDLLLEIGWALERHARSPLLAATLRLMRGPAKAAGLSQLQSFLERGLGAFTSMRGAQEFLEIIDRNERRVINEMFTSQEKEKPGQID
jgi:hypothetical protein